MQMAGEIVQPEAEVSVGRKEKSVLQAKLTKLAIQIGYGGARYTVIVNIIIIIIIFIIYALKIYAFVILQVAVA